MKVVLNECFLKQKLVSLEMLLLPIRTQHIQDQLLGIFVIISFETWEVPSERICIYRMQAGLTSSHLTWRVLSSVSAWKAIMMQIGTRYGTHLHVKHPSRDFGLLIRRLAGLGSWEVVRLGAIPRF
jgi:hypothetical protein